MNTDANFHITNPTTNLFRDIFYLPKMDFAGMRAGARHGFVLVRGRQTRANARAGCDARSRPHDIHAIARRQWDLHSRGNPAGLKGPSAHRVNKCLGRTGTVWNQEYFDCALRKEEAIDVKLDYIMANPVRAGLADHPFDYPWLWRESRNDKYPVIVQP